MVIFNVQGGNHRRSLYIISNTGVLLLSLLLVLTLNGLFHCLNPDDDDDRGTCY